MTASLMTLVLALLSPFVGDANASELTDPTRPAVVAVAAPAPAATPATSFELRLVRVGERDRAAVINQTLVRIGDRIDGAEVRAIEPGRVTLLSEGRAVELTLARGEVKQPFDAATSGRKR